MTDAPVRPRRLASWLLTVGLLLACTGGYLTQTHLARSAEARALADELLGAYINGQNGFQELRDYYERRRDTELRGVRLLDTDQRMKNRYPRDFEPGGWAVLAPIRGADGVTRDWLELTYRPLPPLNSNLALWVALFLLGLAVRQVWRTREERAIAEAARRESEAREVVAESARRETEARLALVERERELERLNDIWSTFYAQISDDSSQMSNHIQALNGFIAQIDINLHDAVHDLYKAPLLGTGDLNDKGHLSLADVKSFLRCLEDRSIEVTREEMAAFVRNVDETIESIRWVIDGLPEYANRQTQPVDPRAELFALLEHLPPNLRSANDGLRIEALVPETAPRIMFNPVHFRSVVKNALYNAAASVRRAQREDEGLAGQITIRFVEQAERLGVMLEDNGTGFAEGVMDKLYRGRVESSNRRRRGGKGSLIVAAYLGFHQATFELANRPEGGARVTFWFNREDAGQPAGAALAEVRA
ncbi:MAG: ATP-binding protein [Candidatus Sericytochromatia bacterium]|nr:ATP-binding protein [Candidatus Sericytochromatia bacterium]